MRNGLARSLVAALCVAVVPACAGWDDTLWAADWADEQAGRHPHASADTWYLRGTSNSWGATPMLQGLGANTFEICQTFQGAPDPRFKIDHLADWSESYPSSDLRVREDTSYLITFDAITKQITVEPVSECDTQGPDAGVPVEP